MPRPRGGTNDLLRTGVACSRLSIFDELKCLCVPVMEEVRIEGLEEGNRLMRQSEVMCGSEVRRKEPAYAPSPPPKPITHDRLMPYML